MISLSQLTELLGWASVINISVLLFTTMMLVLLRTTITTIHSKMFGIPEKELSVLYFSYLAKYKIITLVLIVTPYLSLKIMGQ